ncbi:MAG: hypothetical protein KC619_25190 [Myxococcales bacterium]|nr:hypothetical protein [Myxococcales bacterium]
MRKLLLTTLLTITLIPAAASATVMVEVPIEDMARDADAIVMGRVVSTEVRVVIDPVRGAMPHTLTQIRVAEWIAGSGGATVVVDELGGEIQGQGLAIAGTPVYRAGEEVIVFLERADGRLRTYAMAQGRFEIRRGIGGVPDYVTRDLSDVAFVRWSAGGMTVGHGNDVPVALETFVDHVRRIATTWSTATPGAGVTR